MVLKTKPLRPNHDIPPTPVRVPQVGSTDSSVPGAAGRGRIAIKEAAEEETDHYRVVSEAPREEDVGCRGTEEEQKQRSRNKNLSERKSRLSDL